MCRAPLTIIIYTYPVIIYRMSYPRYTQKQALAALVLCLGAWRKKRSDWFAKNLKMFRLTNWLLNTDTNMLKKYKCIVM
jgi:hypothetical protein